MTSKPRTFIETLEQKFNAIADSVDDDGVDYPQSTKRRSRLKKRKSSIS
ncbi:MAG: hypothetical protein H7329_17985 [Opitutaceae bacterium]|nr:hypothetical protein [Cytophagales bacterium]